MLIDPHKRVAKNKFHAVKVKDDGYTFDSKMEHVRYCQLRQMVKQKLIEGLIVHPKFKAMINDQKICTVILDFQYFDKVSNELVYEDVKGLDTPISKLKRKLVQALYPQVVVRVLTAK